MGVRTVQAFRLLRVGTAGESHTAYAECLDSGGETREYHLRFRENSQTMRTLVNDLVAHEVAGVLGVPLPDHCLVFLPRQLAWGREVREIVGWPVSAGPHFGVERMSPVLAEPTPSLIPRCVNRESFPGYVMLNALVLNYDAHHPQNCLIAERNGKLTYWPVDFGCCLGLPEWDATLVSRMLEPCPAMVPELRQAAGKAAAFRPWFERLRRLDRGRAAWIVERIPREWDLPPDHREALGRFLHGRAAALPRILFANWPQD
jgi:hypothetical protein